MKFKVEYFKKKIQNKLRKNLKLNVNVQ